MNKTITDQLEIYFKDYKDEMLWIFIAFSLLSVIIQLLSNLWLTRKIEHFKNELKRNEIKFSKHSEMQINCLKEMYNIVVDLHFAFTPLINPKYYGHFTLKNNINNFLSVYSSNMEYFHRNKILLTDEINEQIGTIHDRMKINKKLYLDEYSSLSDVEEREGSDDPEIIYGDGEREVEVIKERIEKLNLNESIASFEKDIRKLRKLIEEYFKKLTT